MRQENDISTIVAEHATDAARTDVGPWKTEIRDFLAEIRREIRDVLGSIPAQDANSLAAATTAPLDNLETNNEVSGEGALDRLEMLKRQLNERLQRRHGRMRP